MQAPEHLQRPQNETAAILKKKWKRLNVQNEHWMCVIVGEEGSGKSYTAIKIGEMIDENFGAENVYFHPADVLEDLRDENFQSGDVWVLDEAGVGLGNRTWQDSGQKKLNQALQLVRSHNVGFIFTLPRLDELDKQARGRLQNALEIVNKEDGEYVQGPWYKSNVDRMGMSRSSDSVWWSKPVVRGSEVGAVSFTPPSEDVVEPYEARKQEFQAEFYDETIAELRGESVDDGDGEDERPDPKEIANEIIDEGAEEYVNEINNGAQQVFDADLVAMDYGVGEGTAKRVKKQVIRNADMEEVL